MPRPRHRRWIREEPRFALFKPAGVLASKLKDEILTVDEYEAIRWKDFEKLDQKKSADKMGISQPTFQRILVDAHRKIAKAIVEGMAIKIEGGKYEMVRGRGLGVGRGAGRGLGRGVAQTGGRGRLGGPAAAGPGGQCVCPKCGYKKAHKISTPCYLEVCPKCETKMIRA